MSAPADHLNAVIPHLLGDDSAEARLRAATVMDHGASLLPEEEIAVANAAETRRHEFATGRCLARELMAELGIAAGPIVRGAQREPVWPEGAVGSITHARKTVIAAIARVGAVRSLGIDLELWGRITDKLHGKLFTDAERSWLSGQPPETAGLLFSAKEAGYKATFPLARRFVSFHEAEIDVDWTKREFRCRYIGEHACNRVMEDGIGRFVIVERYVFSLFIIS